MNLNFHPTLLQSLSNIDTPLFFEYSLPYTDMVQTGKPVSLRRPNA
jgi:hypothetical protein